MLADELETRVIELRHLDDTIGGGDLFPVVSKELSDVRGVVQSASYTEMIGRRLLTVVGELAQLAGWAASDARRYTEVQWIYLDGVSAARCADDGPLVAQILSSLSYQIANVERHMMRLCWHALQLRALGMRARLDLRINQVGSLLHCDNSHKDSPSGTDSPRTATAAPPTW